MLFLLFQLGRDRYALDSAQVAEVLPLLGIKQIPQVPRGIVGAFNYRGVPVAVVDLCEFALGRPARKQLSTRIVLVNYADAAGASRLLGLIAEKVTETLRCEPGDFAPAGVTTDAAPYLGPVRADERGLVQWIDPDKLLPMPVRDALFQQLAGHSSDAPS